MPSLVQRKRVVLTVSVPSGLRVPFTWTQPVRNNSGMSRKYFMARPHSKTVTSQAVPDETRERPFLSTPHPLSNLQP